MTMNKPLLTALVPLVATPMLALSSPEVVYEKYDGRRGPSMLDSERVRESLDRVSSDTPGVEEIDSAFLFLFSSEVDRTPPPPPPPVQAATPSAQQANQTTGPTNSSAAVSRGKETNDDEDSPADAETIHQSDTGTQADAVGRSTPFDM